MCISIICVPVLEHIDPIASACSKVITQKVNLDWWLPSCRATAAAVDVEEVVAGAGDVVEYDACAATAAAAALFYVWVMTGWNFWYACYVWVAQIPTELRLSALTWEAKCQADVRTYVGQARRKQGR